MTRTQCNGCRWPARRGSIQRAQIPVSQVNHQTLNNSTPISQTGFMSPHLGYVCKCQQVSRSLPPKHSPQKAIYTPLRPIVSIITASFEGVHVNDGTRIYSGQFSLDNVTDPLVMSFQGAGLLRTSCQRSC